MFEKTLKELQRLNGTRISVNVPMDAEGYVDKECPSKTCGFQFKIMGEDWSLIVRDEEVFCPFCRHAAPAKSWFTTEQVELVRRKSLEHVRSTLGRALSQDAAAWNRRQPRKSFFKMSMSYKPGPAPILLPLSAAEPMRQKATCSICQCRYSYIGAAFFCPSCGNNSAEDTFKQTLKSVRTAAGMHRTLLGVMDRDDAENASRLLREKGMTDTVMALQRLAERLYGRIPGVPPAPRNVFQRVDDGSTLWVDAGRKPYSALLTADELRRLKLYFQQRHLLAHCEGIVDADYITRTGDTSYREGQRLVIREASVLEFVALAEKLGSGLIDSM